MKILASILFLLIAVAAAAQPPQLEIIASFDGGDEAMLYRPSAVAFGDDGSVYVLNAGDSRVLHFAADWSLLGEFGAEGEGPGEFTNPVGMLRRGQEIWVFEMMRATVFSLAGEYRRTVTSQNEMHDPIETERGLLVGLGSSDRLVALMDDELGLITKLGPECPRDTDFMTQFKACGFVHALPHPDHLALLLNPIDGHLWALDQAGDVVREMELADGPGASHANDDGEGNVQMSFSLVMGRGGVDRYGRMWTMPLSYDEAEDEAKDEPQLLIVRDRDLAPVAEYILPDGITAFEVYHAPDGRLLLLDGNSSLIHVGVYPDGLQTG